MNKQYKNLDTGQITANRAIAMHWMKKGNKVKIMVDKPQAK